MAIIEAPRPASNGSTMTADSIQRTTNGGSTTNGGPTLQYPDINTINPINYSKDTEAGAQETDQQQKSVFDVKPPQPDERSTRHLKKLERFQEELEEAAEQIIARRKQYSRVIAIVTYWENAKNLSHMEAGAKSLLSLLQKEEKYGFETHEYKIKRTCLNRTFIREITDYVDEIGQDTNSLFVLYYGGHAKTEGDACLWMAENDHESPRINWSTAQEALFQETTCDKVFLFDCCHAGDMIRRGINWQGACELLGAASGAATASAIPSNSFTQALLRELEAPGLDIKQLWTTLTDSKKRKEYSLKVDPYYFDFSGGQHPFIALRTMHGKVDPSAQEEERTYEALDKLTDARVLIKVTFEGDAPIIMQQWRTFLSQSPKDISKLEFRAYLEERLQLVGLFQSNSSTAIIQMPVWLWAALSPTVQHCEFLAVIRSDNWADTGPKSTPHRLGATSNRSVPLGYTQSRKLQLERELANVSSGNFKLLEGLRAPTHIPLSISPVAVQSITPLPPVQKQKSRFTEESMIQSGGAFAPGAKGSWFSKPASASIPARQPASTKRSPTRSPTMPKFLTTKTGSGASSDKQSDQQATKGKRSEKKEVKIADKIERSGLSLNALRDELKIGFAPPGEHSLARLPEILRREKRCGSGVYGDLYRLDGSMRVTLWDQD